MRTQVCCIFVFVLSTLSVCHAQQLRGTVSNALGEPIPGASVYISESTYGVVTDLKGRYFLELETGTYQVVYQALGYKSKTFSIKIASNIQEKHVVLGTNSIELGAVTVTAGEDPAYAIMRRAIANKKKYRNQVDLWKARIYNKASLESHKSIEKIDSTDFSFYTDTSKKHMDFVESISDIYYRAPNEYKEVKLAYQDHSKKRSLNFGNSIEMSANFTPPTDEYGPPAFGDGQNALLFYTNVSDADFNFYQNLLDLPKLYDKPYSSPLSSTAFLSYFFKLEGSFQEDGMLVHRIKVIPRRDFGAFFSGYIYIVDKEWCIKAVEFEIDKNALNLYKNFSMFINYEQVADSFWLPTREEFFYNTEAGNEKIIGHTATLYSDYEINPELPRRFFDNALSVVNDTAEDKSLEFWQTHRPITLKPEETAFIKDQDSIRAHYKSPEYINSADSSYNHTDIWSFLLTGVGYRNSFKGYRYYFAPLIAQPRPFAVGGYRHALAGSYSNTNLENRQRLSTSANVSFGLLNTDFRGDGEISYMYAPMRQSEITVGGGSIYEMINTYESVAATFSRSNYVLSNHIKGSYRTEISNGLYGRFTLRYSNQQSLENYQLADWSNSLFGQLNEPEPFEEYTKMIFETHFTIRFDQKYLLRPYRKIILGSKYPKLNVHYKWGMPNVFNSMVNFHYLEMRVKDDFNIGQLGTSRYHFIAGSFINPKAKRFIDNRFFRRSDPYFFSNPLYSFNLLGIDMLYTDQPFLQGNYIHHFKGSLLNKVPLIKHLGIRSVVGSAVLAEASNDFFHFESFVGIEKPIRIRETLFKIGCYYVGANSTHSNLDSQIKFGIDFYNPFTGSWNY